MPSDTITEEPTEDAAVTGQSVPAVTATDPEQLVEEDLLVEEVSIDGMCGVY